MSDLVERAYEFAYKAHTGQVRKYTGEPYINHCVSVAGIVASVKNATDEMVAAALLHDVIEDCGVKAAQLVGVFGVYVADYVAWLSDISVAGVGNRVARKKLDREHIAQAPAEAKTIKLADLIDNTRTIVRYDPDFAKVYLVEKWLLLDVLSNGDIGLWEQALRQVSFDANILGIALPAPPPYTGDYFD